MTNSSTYATITAALDAQRNNDLVGTLSDFETRVILAMRALEQRTDYPMLLLQYVKPLWRIHETKLSQWMKRSKVY